MIEFTGVWYSYPDSEWVLKGLELTVSPGEYLLVCGASGSGKSSLAYLCNGLIPHFFGGTLQGSVQIEGCSTTEKSVAELFPRVGLVLQNCEAQLFNSTVQNELAFGLESLGCSGAEIEQRIEKVCQTLGITSLLERDTAQLSGGEKRLVAIASVLCLEPAVIVVDEPYGDLDWLSMTRVRAALRSIRQQGTTIIVIEQTVGPFLDDVDRCLIMEGGEVLLVERPEFAREVLRDLHLLPRYPEEKKGVASSDTILEVRDLCCRFDNRMILEDISFDLRAGETIAIVGRNGSGKTTLIKHLNGLLTPAGGEVRFLGERVAEKSAEEMAALVGLCFQNANDQFFKYRVRDEIMVGPEMLAREDRELFSSICHILELEALLDRSPYKLSEGEKKRVAIASILALAPRVLVLDEPTAGQDGRFRETLAHKLRASEKNGMSVVVVTHDLDFARAVASRWLVLHDGRLVADGPPEELCADEGLVRAGALECQEKSAVGKAAANDTGVERPVEGHQRHNLLRKERAELLDPRTRLALGLLGIVAVFIATRPTTLFLELGAILAVVAALGSGRKWLASLKMMAPVAGLVFAIGLVAFGLQPAVLLTVRLVNLLNVSFILFSSISTDEMGQALGKLRLPFEITFILTTAMRYVPLIKRKMKNIMEAQRSRGIDLKLRLRNARNLAALLMPLLVQTFVLADELALAMESRGFSRKERSSWRELHLCLWEYGVMLAAVALLAVFYWGERG
ncbi:MAG: ATP-binding cassette domain-containing protein [Deltaproteobacteria bacterium]|nr:ATP-binding cassette domain-containing protein [Deltaproteobacteria bacterium]